MKYLSFIILFFSVAVSQFDWQDNGVPLRQGAHIEWQRTGTVGENGEVILVWSDTRNGGRDVYAQKVDELGQNVWSEGGVPVVSAEGRQEDPLAISDGAGGAYIVWKDYRYELDDGDVFVQHILSDGSLDWAEEGIALSDVEGPQEFLNMCSDGMGGAFVIWNDRSTGSSTGGDIYATHLSLTGDILDAGTGKAIITDGGDRGSISLETGGAGYANLVWSEAPDTDWDVLMGQRVDLECETLWSEPEEGGMLLISSSSGDLQAPRVTHVSGDTAAVVWEDYRNNSISADVFLQFIDGNGNELLTSGGIAVCIDPGKQSVPRVKADVNTAYVVWEDFRNHPLWGDVYGQAVSLDGTILWEEDGKPISTADRKQTEPRLVVDGINGAYFIWMDERNAEYPQNDIFLQNISREGVEIFEEDGLAISQATNYQFNPLVRPDGNGGAFACWGDQRTGSIGLYVQHVIQEGGITLEEDGLEVYYGIGGDALYHQAVTLDDNKTLIYWQDMRAGGETPQTYGVIVTPDFDPAASLNGVLLSTNPHQLLPQAVATENRIFLSFQGKDEEGALNQYYQILDFDLNTISDSTGLPVYENLFGFNQEYAALTAGEDGYIYFAFSDLRESDYDIYLQKYSTEGDPQWLDGGILVGGLSNDDIIQAVEPLPGAGCVVSWNGGPWNDLNIFAQAVDENGGVASGWSEEPMVVSDAEGYQLNVLMHRAGDSLVFIWEDTRNQNSDVFAQVISSSGIVLGETDGFVVTEKPNDQNVASAIFNPATNEVFICWEDFESGYDFDLLAVTLELSNLLLSEEISIASESGDQLEASLGLSNENNYLIPWQDSRGGGEPDLYYQQLGPEGAVYPEGGTVVCDEPFAQETPLVVRYNSSDDAHIIVWQDMRSSGKEELRNVYAQSVTIEESAVEQGDLYPGSIVLHQNYPNPFNPNTAIKFTVPEKSNLRISIYDLLGREVRTLVNGRMEAGEFKVDWNGKDNSGHPLSSGTFFCKLESKSLVTGQKYRQTIRVTFIK